MAITINRENFKNPESIIAYMTQHSDDVTAEEIKTFYDILINTEHTPQDLVAFLNACASAEAFKSVDAPNGTLDEIFKDVFGRYPDEVIEVANSKHYDCDIPEGTTDADEAFIAVFKGYYAAAICDILAIAIETAEGIESDDD